jgi:hypothetical protein
MINTNTFSMDNLSNNPEFDFINKISNNFDSDAEDNSFNFFDTNDNDSPYKPSNFKCTYLDTLETCSYLKNDNRISVMSLNIQCLSSKFNELKDSLDLFESSNCLPDIILLQEIWNVHDASLFTLNQYHPLIFKCRSNSKGGGVGIYVKSVYKFDINPSSVFWDRIFESIIINVWINNKMYVVGSLYRCINHPTLTAKEQFTEFSDLFSNLISSLSSCELILGGDLNLDALKVNSCPLASSYFDLLFANGFIQSVTRPTRCTSSSATCLDHFLTNFNQNSYESIIVVSMVSDHFPVIFLKDQCRKHVKLKQTTTRDFSENNITCFMNQLASTDWGGISAENDPGIAFDNFSNTFGMIHESFFAPKIVRFNKNIHKRNPWMTAGLLTSRINKLKLAKLCFTSPNPTNKAKYVIYRNLYNSLIRTSKKMYFVKSLEVNSKNLKKTWALLNEAINSKRPNNSVHEIIFNGITINNPAEIAQKFNQFFTSIAANLCAEINPSTLLIDDSPCTAARFDMSSLPISYDELIATVNCLQDKKNPRF